MSLAIISKLRATASITDDLANGVSSVKYLHEKQGSSKPYIVVQSRIRDPHDNYSSQTVNEYEVRVIIVASQPHTEGALI